MESSFKIARVAGVELGASWSWLIVVAIVVWSLAVGFYPATYPDLSGGTHLVMAVVTAALFFGSVLLHELGHATRARREGVPIEGITLWLFGGVAKMEHSPRSAASAFRVSAAGPLISAGLVALFGVAAIAGSQLDLYDGVQGVLDYLARINLVILVFNLVPALPLDGGRILQAWLWHRTGNFTQSTVQAATAGRWFGYLLITVGVLSVLGGGALGGIWIGLIGWFLVQAATAEATHAMLRGSLGPLRVEQLMTPDPVTVPADLPVDDFLDQAWQTRHSTFPVMRDGDLAGLVSVGAAARLPAADRTERRVADIMSSRREVPTVQAHQEVADVLEELAPEPRRLVVVDDGRVVGMLAPSDVTRAVEHGRAGQPPPEGRAGLRSFGPLAGVVLLVVLALVAGYLYHPPLAVLAPGEVQTVENGIRVNGVPVSEVDGDYQLTSVRISDTNAWGAAVAWLRSDREVVPVDEVQPENIEHDRYIQQQRALFEESQQLAAAAGASAAGYEVKVSGDGAEIIEVLPGSPADSEGIEAGDVIIAADGSPIQTSADLRDRLRGARPGTNLRLRLDRADGGDDTVSTQVERLSHVSGQAGIGVLVMTENLAVDVPFQVSFSQDENLAGPSGGLAYALAITDLLEQDDLAQGRTIAATGTISLDGSVGPVGAADLKARAAQDAGADLFVVPEADADNVDDPDIQVRSARSLDDALELPETTT